MANGKVCSHVVQEARRESSAPCGMRTGSPYNWANQRPQESNMIALLGGEGFLWGRSWFRRPSRAMICNGPNLTHASSRPAITSAPRGARTAWFSPTGHPSNPPNTTFFSSHLLVRSLGTPVPACLKPGGPFLECGPFGGFSVWPHLNSSVCGEG